MFADLPKGSPAKGDSSNSVETTSSDRAFVRKSSGGTKSVRSGSTAKPKSGSVDKSSGGVSIGSGMDKSGSSGKGNSTSGGTGKSSSGKGSSGKGGSPGKGSPGKGSSGKGSSNTDTSSSSDMFGGTKWRHSNSLSSETLSEKKKHSIAAPTPSPRKKSSSASASKVQKSVKTKTPAARRKSANGAVVPPCFEGFQLRGRTIITRGPAYGLDVPAHMAGPRSSRKRRAPVRYINGS